MRTVTLGTATIPYRVVAPGTDLQMLLLGCDQQGVVGVDLDSGAFVRATHPPVPVWLEPFSVVKGEIAGAVEPPDAARPEALELTAPPEIVGHYPVRRAERLLAPLHHPPRLPLLGLTADAVPYWTLSGDQPSLALIELRNDPRLRAGQWGPECHFVWQGAQHQLPLADLRLLAAIEAEGVFRPTRSDVQRLLGYRPRRLLIMLTPPIEGYCHKTVAALLPTARG
jgi:hypothetical protein